MAIPGWHRGRLLLLLLIAVAAVVHNEAEAAADDNNFSTRHKRQQKQQRGGGGGGRSSFILTEFFGVADSETDVMSLQSTADSGQWSEWSSASECSRTCGGGVSTQSRECLQRGEGGEPTCVGAMKRHYSCNVEECPEAAQDFRSEQCSRFDGVPFESRHYEWIPYTRAPNKCELNCMPKGERFYYRHRRKVIDGTRCDDQQGTDVCVDGKCLPVGCDMMLGSKAKEDACRVCGGDGSSCNSVQGVHDANNFQTGYNDILLIPVGATNIKIREIKASNNYLAIRNTSGHYYLNGNWRIDFPREMKFAGCNFHYERKPHAFIAPETISALGPTTEALYVVLLYQEPNPGIEYEYSFPKDVSLPQGDSYNWIYGSWSDCSATCGGGVQTRNVSCAKTLDFEVVSDDLCDPQLQPPVNRTCASDPCSPEWFIGNWTKCSSNCQPGVQHRTVYCQQVVSGSKQSVADDKVCIDSNGPRPAASQACNEDAVCPTFHIGEWGPCDKLCGEGKRNRKVTCHRKTDGRAEKLEDSDCEDPLPARTESCFLRPCEGVDWIVSDWLGCKGNCGLELETRKVQCGTPKGQIYADQFCHDYRKPESNRTCADATACEYNWFASQWSDCSSDCGAGIQTRRVFCGTTKDDTVTKVDDDKCDPTKKYENTTTCHVAEDACVGMWYTSPWSECSKQCGSGSRTRSVLCLAKNETVDIKQCGVDTIPFAEEKCNVDPCNETMSETTTAAPKDDLVEVCEEEEEGEEGDEEEEESTTKAPKPKPGAVTTKSPAAAAATTKSPKPDSMMTTSGTAVGGTTAAPDKADGAASTAKPDENEMSGSGDGGMPLMAEGSGDSESSGLGLVLGGVTAPPTIIDSGSGDEMGTSSRRRRQAEAEELLIPAGDGGSGMGSGVGSSGLGSGMILGESGSGLDGVDPSKMEAEEEISTTDKTGLLQSENVLPVSTSTMKPTGKDVTTKKPTGTTKKPDGKTTATTTKAPGKSKAKKLAGGKKKQKFCKVVVPERPNCNTTQHGCCPDGTTPAKGPFGADCPKYETCEDAEFKCCPDGVTPAKGPKNMGCESDACKSSLFGCCPDGFTEAEGNDEEGCPQPTPEPPTAEETEDGFIKVSCKDSEFGCCPDQMTPATGGNNEGCFQCESSDMDGSGSGSGSGAGECDSCDDTKYGCCPDGLRQAKGPDGEGCEAIESGSGEMKLDSDLKCKETEFGCCLDAKTAASGLNYAGCDTPCAQAKFGCCDDNVTAAHGPLKEGCCLNTEFGCCPDNIGAAQGAQLEGCSCQYGPFGCCPDNTTSARGPGNQGCGCVYTENGCCPDSYTPAGGPSYQGCGCHTFEFGCCPDLIMVAKGPNLEGCGCENTAHGCCQDGRTPATGPQFEGCGCESSKYGCCLDGIASSQGPNFEGCEEKPTLSGEVCALDKDRGSCRNFTVKWFFDMEYGGCSRFWWGGCDGNDNRFASQDDCKAHCVEPEGIRACSLPRVSGPCEGNYPSWYHDTLTGSCRQFRYGGCLGNSNRFATKEECAKQCVAPKLLDKCEKPQDAGGCMGNFSRWSYDKETMTCKEFGWSGCQGNENNFLSERECHLRCKDSARSRVSTRERCNMKADYGRCHGSQLRWHFDSRSEQCHSFLYSGCGGNPNRFDSHQACASVCGEVPRIHSSTPIPSGGAIEPYRISTKRPKEDDTCKMPRAIGDCKEFTERWYYDEADEECRAFLYGGCGGNANNFESLTACRSRCQTDPGTSLAPEDTSPVEQDFRTEFCFLGKDEGSCDESQLQWFYDRNDGVCKQFLYRGCDGNQNRFATRQECESRCSQSQDVCILPRVVGPCSGSFRQWYYEAAADTCYEFDYGGCQGNPNRFNNAYECQQRCQRSRSPTTTTSPYAYPEEEREPERQPDRGRPQRPQQGDDVCSLDVEPGPCRASLPAWFYNRQSGRCEAFSYGGCDGNANRFHSEEQCERQCGSFRGQDVCRLPPDGGPCRGSFRKYYFDRASLQCQELRYGGCRGNGNRFSSLDECQSLCLQRSELAAPGNATSDSNQENEIDVGSPSEPYKPSPYDSCSEANANCQSISCAYGIERYVSNSGCDECRCYEPCRGFSCPDGTQCQAELVREQGDLPTDTITRVQPTCRPVTKEGRCPVVQRTQAGRANCEEECRSDADCQGDNKCCFNGCGRSCMSVSSFPLDPYSPVTTRPPVRGGTPPKIVDGESRVAAEEGTVATLRCEATGNPAPKIYWRRGNEEIVHDEGKYKIESDGSLQIIGVGRSDSGSYTCIADNGVGTSALKQSQLDVKDPSVRGADIVGDQTMLVVVLGGPVIIHCHAIGWPRPSVTWWRGERMLPLSSERYEQFRDYSLLVRRVSFRDLGPYTCQAYNGYGRPSSFTVVLQAVGPVYSVEADEVEFQRYLIPAPQPEQRPPVSSATTISPFRPARPTPPSYTPAPQRPTLVAPTARAWTEQQNYPVGADIHIHCDVQGYPQSRVTWYKDNNQVTSSDRLQHAGNNSLIITGSESSDSGIYRCEAINLLGESNSQINLAVDGVYLDPNCTDNPFFANCKLIVKARFCTNKYYARFCCKSCTLAGQLPSTGPHLLDYKTGTSNRRRK